MSTIKNSMNNCFLNSIVQLLTCSLDIEACFLKPVYRTLFTSYSKQTNIDVHDLMMYYKEKLQPWIEFGRHQDAHESLGYILDDSDDKLPFEIHIDQICTYPNEISKSSQKENVLFVPLKSSIQESVDSYFETQESYEYEDKGKKFISPKIEKLPGNTPDYLFITTLRMKTSLINGLYREMKIHNDIEISSYITYGNKKYRAIGYIVHRGELQCGHYNTVKIFEGEWYIFDDEHKIKLEDQSQGLNFQSGAYIYLYKKDDTIVDSPKIYKPTLPLLPVIKLLNNERNNNQKDVIDVDRPSNKKSKRYYATIEAFINLSKPQREEYKEKYDMTNEKNKTMLLNHFKDLCGPEFGKDDIVSYLFNIEQPDYFNPLLFFDIDNFNKFIYDIIKHVDNNYYAEKWFESKIEERIKISNILKQNFCNDYNKPVEKKTSYNTNDQFDLIDIPFENLPESERLSLYNELKDDNGCHLTMNDCARIWNETPLDGIIEPMCFKNKSLNDNFDQYMKKYVDQNYSGMWYEYDEEKRRDITSLIVEKGFTYNYHEKKNKFNDEVVDIDKDYMF